MLATHNFWGFLRSRRLAWRRGHPPSLANGTNKLWAIRWEKGCGVFSAGIVEIFALQLTIQKNNWMFTDGDIAPACVNHPPAKEIIDPVTKAKPLEEADENSSRKNVAGSEISSSAGFCACHYRQSDCRQALIFTFVPIRRKGRRDLDCFFGFCFFLSSTLFHISRCYSTLPQLSTQKNASCTKQLD